VKALVTGAGGFLGSQIVEDLLARGHAVRGLCRRDYPALTARGVEIVRADLRDRQAVIEACRGIDAVFHTAAAAGIWGSWKHYYAVNVRGSAHVVEGCRAQGVRRLVFTSSPSVTFEAADQAGVDESAPYCRRWLCHYAHSKALAEQHVLAANGADGLATCALRPHLIWGPRDPHLVPRLIARARAGRLCRIGDGTNRIDTIYVDNAALAHLQAAEALEPGSPVAGRAYFISQGEPVNCWDWIDQILALAGLPAIRKSISPRAAWRMGALLESLWRLLFLPGEPPMTRFLAVELSTTHYFDISRARKDFGYEPRVSTVEGMRRLAAALAAESPPRSR
jgi:nucleoside-diphosphate-sugar epimerase